ncbi:hypothetical protein YC2023_115706 [Brassica napus]
MVPPAYYAHLAAFRARFYMRKEFSPNRLVYGTLSNKLMASNKTEMAYKLFLKIKGARSRILAKKWVALLILMFCFKVKIVDMSIFKDQYVEEREKFPGCVLIFEKLNGDGSQSVKMELSKRLIEERVGVKPYIADLLGGSFSSL